MYSIIRGICAASALALIAGQSEAAIIRTARHASTSNRTISTTTAGQRSILMTCDPLNVAAFSLDVTFEAQKVEFGGIKGLNGYVIDFFQFSTDGNAGGILNIHGYYPGFNDHRDPVDGQVITNVEAPPAGELDIFQLTFLDHAPDQDKTFNVFASDDADYITAFDTATNTLTSAIGPYNPITDQGVDGAISTVAGVTAVPLPGGLAAGLLGGIVALAGAKRRRSGSRA
jgi:hypothetical protein